MIQPNTINQGDCLELMNQIESGSIDMVLCDLPYGTTKCKWDVVIPFDKLWEHYIRVVKENGAILLFGTEPFSSHLRLSNLKMYRYDWYWEKEKGTNFLFANSQPHKVMETISCFYSKQPAYNPQKIDNPKGTTTRHLYASPKFMNTSREIMGESWDDDKLSHEGKSPGKNYEPDKLLPRQLIYFPRDQLNRMHPTQKPLALCEYLIRTYTGENDVVLDNTAGSGTTGVACVNTDRRFILIEQEDKYVEASKARVNDAVVEKYPTL